MSRLENVGLHQQTYDLKITNNDIACDSHGMAGLSALMEEEITFRTQAGLHLPLHNYFPDNDSNCVQSTLILL